MVSPRIIITTALAVSLGANALSSGCTTAVVGLAFGDLGSCLQLTSALGLLQAQGSIISQVDSYLNSLCADGTPICANGTLTSAQTTLASGCASDREAGGADGAEVTVLDTILKSYPQVRSAACSKNTTTGDFCVSSTLSTIQNSSGTNLTIDFLTTLFGGSSTEAFTNAASSGQLCTGCVSEIYAQALEANSTVANTTLGQGLTSQCGANFGTAQASDVSAPSIAATSQAAASSSPSGAAGVTASVNMAPWLLAIGTITLGAAVGGAAIL